MPINQSALRTAVFQKRYLFLLLLFFVLAYILPLGARDLLEPDETRYAEIPREMIASGDWIVPRLDNLRYFEKPALGYWVSAGSLLLFGENNFAVRLPSALAVGLSAVLIFALAVRVRRSEDKNGDYPALFAALVFLSSFEVFGVGNAAVLDSLFSLFVTATIAAFFLASEEAPDSGRERIFLILSGLSCGLAFLTKGFVAFAVPVLALAPYLLLQRRYLDLLRMSWLPLLAAVLVSMPWALMIQSREPDFWRFFFWNEHIRRFLADNAQHKESFWFFVLTAPAMFIPWTFMIPAAIPGIRTLLNESGAKGRLLKLSACWLAIPFLFFSFSNGKLLTYILPCFPPAALLTSFGLWEALFKERWKKRFQGAALFNAAFFGVVLLSFLLLQFSGYHGFHPYGKPWKMVMAVNGLLFLVIFCIGAFRSKIAVNKILLFGMAPLFLFFIFHFAIPDATNAAKAPGRFLEPYKKGIDANAVIISDEESLKSVCWYWGRTDVSIIGSAGELDYGLNYKDARDRVHDIKDTVALIAKNKGKTILIARDKNFSQWQKQLPQPLFIAESKPLGYVLLRY
ncbi:MAG: phospholipid carrier-dependent glycosyltransferase [Syntrophales bacterium]